MNRIHDGGRQVIEYAVNIQSGACLQQAGTVGVEIGPHVEQACSALIVERDSLLDLHVVRHRMNQDAGKTGQPVAAGIGHDRLLFGAVADATQLRLT